MTQFSSQLQERVPFVTCQLVSRRLRVCAVVLAERHSIWRYSLSELEPRLCGGNLLLSGDVKPCLRALI